MIRQAHTYLVGAMGGATLIAIAIAVFVLLVSAQVFRDWPIAALGGGEEAAVSEAQQAAPVGADAQARPGDGGGAAAGTAGANDGRQGRAGPRASGGSVAAGGGIGSTAAGDNATEPGSSDGAGGEGGGADGSPQTTNTSNPASGTGAASSGGGGGGKSSGGSGGSTSSPSGQVAETVNNTVNQVDETALGGTLGNSGVTEATEGVVNGVAGPESTVGKVVDEAVGAVGGLLGSKP
jgi:hypothetical protein